MRVPTDSFTNSLIQSIDTLSSQQSQYQLQLSSGLAITNPSDAPATVGGVMNMDAELSTLQQLNKNNATATQVAQQSYAALSSMQQIATTATQLAENGANGTTAASSYEAYSTQLGQLIQQAVQTANTQYNGQYIFGGTQTAQAPFAVTEDANGNVTNVAYKGTQQGIAIQTAEGSTTSPYTDGTTNQGMADFINQLVTLKSAMDSQSSTAVAATQAGLQTSENNIIDAVSGVGAVQSGLEADSSLNQAKFTSLQGLVSNETSVDVATTSVQLSQAQTAYQAALESSAKIMQTSLLDYLT